MSGKPRLLVVDDNIHFLELASAVFEREFEVLTASDGEEGLKLAREKRPVLVLLDVMMPRVSGVEVLRSLQAEAETRSVPVIVITARQMDAAAVQVFTHEPNVKAFLMKPIAVPDLRKEVKKALGG